MVDNLIKKALDEFDGIGFRMTEAPFGVDHARDPENPWLFGDYLKWKGINPYGTEWLRQGKTLKELREEGRRRTAAILRGGNRRRPRNLDLG